MELIRKVSEDDKAWFEQHPTKSFRLRDYVPGEFLSVDDTYIGFVIVVRHGDNKRTRDAVYLPKALMPYVIGAVRVADKIVLDLQNISPEVFAQYRDHFRAHKNILIPIGNNHSGGDLVQ